MLSNVRAVSHAERGAAAATVRKEGEIVVHVPAQGVDFSRGYCPRPAQQVTLMKGATAFSSAVKAHGRAVILGDISGSMRQGNRLACLKKSFRTIIASRLRSQQPLALAGWDAWTSWCTRESAGGSGGSNGSSGAGDETQQEEQQWERERERGQAAVRWITESGDRVWANEWVERLRVRGGNNMRYAIEDAMRHFPDATDIYIMCDGDVAPFFVSDQPSRPRTQASNANAPTRQDVARPLYCSDEAKRGTVDWQVYLLRPLFRDVKFHFIALGKGADASAMQKMAAIGASDFIDVQE